MDSVSCKKRVRDGYEATEFTESTQSELKRFKEDFLDELDDSDVCTTSQDLDSFMKSFEQEISGSVPANESNSGESRPDLGYLLGASDDDLGIPPSVSNENLNDTELFRVTSESVGLSELWRFDDYNSFGFELSDDGFGYDSNSNVSEFVAVDSLFDYTDVGFGSPEILPAV
ncbi:Calmodulin-regulated spectrin-associated protein [Heracleum sosnowskyi]|uniref:Calmodulin-regulated spectrin-associated protein n=1 Tax=Heracleum sosnowskyi TaxID=360622 RepID=A0AAD8MPQ7_9APIA|nr:Calmodulin-regulated spectrin-associated protein [Heracleum sosnowskyi]